MCSGKSKVSIEEKLCQKNNMRKQGEFCAFFIAVGDVWWKCSYVFSRRDRIMFPWACPKLHATTLIFLKKRLKFLENSDIISLNSYGEGVTVPFRQ